MSTTMTASTTAEPVPVHHEPPAYTKSSLPTYSKDAPNARQPTSTTIAPQSPNKTSTNRAIPAISLLRATEAGAGASRSMLPSSATSPIAQSPFSPAISIHSIPSVRDFAHPPDSPEHFLPSPTIEPSETRRPGPRRAYPGSLALPAPIMSPNGDELPAYSSDQRARRTVFKSEDDYLAALSAWAEEKLYSDAPKDSKGRSVGLSGFYGTMSSEDYVAREERRRGGPNVGKAKVNAPVGTSGVKRRESGSKSSGGNEGREPQRKEGISRVRTIETPANNGEDVGSSSAGQDESGRRRSIAQWMRKKTGSGS